MTENDMCIMLHDIMCFIRNLPEGTETTVYEAVKAVRPDTFVEEDYYYNNKLIEFEDWFTITAEVFDRAYKEGLILDTSAHDDEVTGLPFHTPFIKRYRDNEITSLVLEWENCCCCSADELMKSRLAIYLRKNKIVYEEFDGYGHLIKSGSKSCRPDKLFFLLNTVAPVLTREPEYVMRVCDGSQWKLKLRYSDNFVRILNGYVDYPPFGKLIEDQIIKLCEEVGIFEPHLWSCSDDIDAFADNWIAFFEVLPQKNNYIFEEFMGEDCRRLGFEMDLGESFIAKYGEGSFEIDEFITILPKVKDVHLLGTAIFSQWRYLTHWAYVYTLDDEVKDWFIYALKRLKEIV